MRSTFEAEGDVRGTDLLAGLVELWREGASGTLQFSRSGATAGFELVAGEIVATSSSDQRFETASILVRAGKLDTGTLVRLAAPEGADRALVALQAGVLTRREWRWGEKIRAVEVLSDLLTWIEGEYWLFRTTGRDAGEFRLSIPRLILELFLRSRDRSLVLHHLGGADVPLARAAAFDAEFAAFGLTADAESVVGLIDGHATAAEIASEAPADAFAVEKLLAALVTLGLVHPEFAPAAVFRVAARPVPEEDSAEARGELVEEPSAEEGPEEEPDVAPEGEEIFVEDASLQMRESPPVDVPLQAHQAGETDLDARALGADDSSYGERLRFEDAGVESEPVSETPLDLSTGVGAGERPRSRAGSPVLWVFVLLAAGVAAVLWLKGRGPSASLQAVAEPTPSPTAIAEAVLAPTAEPTPVPSPEATTRPARSSPTRPSAATPRPARTKAPGRAPGAAASSGASRETSREYWVERAGRDQKRANTDRRDPFTIQLELACEVASLVDAWKHDRPVGTMWVLTTSFQGRTCFRVLWGRYPTREAARRALSGVPGFFSTPKNRPMATAVR